MAACQSQHSLLLCLLRSRSCFLGPAQGKCLSPTCPSRVCAGLSSPYTLSGRVELPSEKLLGESRSFPFPRQWLLGRQKREDSVFHPHLGSGVGMAAGTRGSGTTRTTHLADYFAQALCRGDCTQEVGTQAVCSLCLQIQAGPVKVKGKNRSKAGGQDAKVAWMLPRCPKSYPTSTPDLSYARLYPGTAQWKCKGQSPGADKMAQQVKILAAQPQQPEPALCTPVLYGED